MTQLMKAVKQFISDALYAALLTAGRVNTILAHRAAMALLGMLLPSCTFPCG